MNIQKDLLNFYIYRKIIKKKQADKILEDCTRHGVSVREYMLAKEYVTEPRELTVLGDYHCLPSVELEMLDIDKSLFDLFSFEFMKRNKVIPVWRNEEGLTLLATARPLDCSAMSAIATRITGPFDYVLVPPGQIDRYIDSISAMISSLSSSLSFAFSSSLSAFSSSSAFAAAQFMRP